MEEYSAADYDADADYVVDFIVAERKTKGKKKEYLVKWKVIHMLGATYALQAMFTAEL